MFARFRFLAAVALIISGGAWLTWLATAQPAADKQPEKQPEKPAYRFSGPYTHDNLTIFLVHGEDRLKGRKYMMLAEALEKKLFVIHETQKVNDLTMENLSATDEVLILSGDILKGGQQDRIAQHDQFVPPKSGKVALAVFCVERTASRWMKPLTDEDKTFHSSPGQICFNSLRLANRVQCSQGKCWMEVRNAQDKLSANAKVDVKAKESDSSLALSVQAKEVQAATEKYVAKLSSVVKDKNDVIGYAYAINGKIYATDIYCSPKLFEKAWPRLIQANAIEAFADMKKDQKFADVTVDNVKKFQSDADNGKASAEKKVADGVQQTTRESAYNIRIGSSLHSPAPSVPPGAEAKKEAPLELRSNSIAK